MEDKILASAERLASLYSSHGLEYTGTATLSGLMRNQLCYGYGEDEIAEAIQKTFTAKTSSKRRMPIKNDVSYFLTVLSSISPNLRRVDDALPPDVLSALRKSKFPPGTFSQIYEMLQNGDIETWRMINAIEESARANVNKIGYLKKILADSYCFE